VKLWKVVGMAGLAGVAATGVVVARAERRRRHFEPDDVRARLHERYHEAVQVETIPPTGAQGDTGGPARGRRRRVWPGLRAGIRRPRRSS